MQISVNVQLGQDETFAHTPAEAAGLILTALSGDPETDYCTCQVVASAIPGVAGTSPGPMAPPNAYEDMSETG